MIPLREKENAYRYVRRLYAGYIRIVINNKWSAGRKHLRPNKAAAERTWWPYLLYGNALFIIARL